jgi:hypothetical protein
MPVKHMWRLKTKFWDCIPKGEIAGKRQKRFQGKNHFLLLNFYSFMDKGTKDNILPYLINSIIFLFNTTINSIINYDERLVLCPCSIK